jgi:hypothetical protein
MQKKQLTALKITPRKLRTAKRKPINSSLRSRNSSPMPKAATMMMRTTLLPRLLPRKLRNKPNKLKFSRQKSCK